MIRDALSAVATVFQHALRKPVTQEYPEVKPFLPPRYRGRIVLTRDPDGEERCVACNLCAVACPVGCISLQATEDEQGRRLAEFFRINFSRCIFCGLRSLPIRRWSLAMRRPRRRWRQRGRRC
jgi:NADH-quinone oxidoreductase subunit I